MNQDTDEMGPWVCKEREEAFQAEEMAGALEGKWREGHCGRAVTRRSAWEVTLEREAGPDHRGPRRNVVVHSRCEGQPLHFIYVFIF